MVFYICEVASIKSERVQQAIAKIGENVLKRFIPIYILRAWRNGGRMRQ